MRPNSPTVQFEDVTVIDTRPEHPEKPGGPSQEKSIRCRFADGKERFVARSQVPSYQEFPARGETFDLEVSEWMVMQWEEADAAPPVVDKYPDVVCLRRLSERSILVRFPDGAEEVCPQKGISKLSPIQDDGDRGELWVEPWLTKMKNWGSRLGPQLNRPPRASGSVSDDIRRSGSPDQDPNNGFEADEDSVPF